MNFLKIIALFIIGSCIGSFISVLIHRLPKKEDIVFKRSYCPNCQNTIPLKDLIPLISWVFNRGRCSHCKNSISKTYIYHELIMGLAFSILYYNYLLTKEFFFLSSLMVILYSISIIDLKHYLIPDSLQTALLCHSILFDPYNLETKLLNSLIYFSLSLTAAYITKKIIKKNALGWGDVKFFFITGFYISYNSIPLFFFIVGILGIISGLIWEKITKQKFIPFAPSLSIALYVTILSEDYFNMDNIIRMMLFCIEQC